MLVYEFFPARRQHHLLVVWLSDSKCIQHSDFHFPQYDRIASAPFCQKFGGTQVEKDSASNMLWASQKLRTGTQSVQWRVMHFNRAGPSGLWQ